MEHQELTLLFPSQGDNAKKRKTLIFTAVIALSIAALAFVLIIFSSGNGQMAIQLGVTVPSIIGVFALIGAATLKKAGAAVEVDQDELRIDQGKDIERHAWGELAWSRVDQSLGQTGRVLKIYDTQGKLAVQIPETIEDFDCLIDAVRERLSDQPESLRNAVGRKQGRKQALLLAGIGVVMLAVALGNVWMTYHDAANDARLAAEGEDGQATIVRKFLAPNGVTTRIEYELMNDAGVSAMHNVEVEPLLWELLSENDSVAVVWVPDAPHLARLQAGEIGRDDPLDRPVVSYGLSVAVGLLALLGLVAGVLSWFGWDLDFDSQTRKLSIKRLGEGR